MGGLWRAAEPLLPLPRAEPGLTYCRLHDSALDCSPVPAGLRRPLPPPASTRRPEAIPPALASRRRLSPAWSGQRDGVTPAVHRESPSPHPPLPASSPGTSSSSRPRRNNEADMTGTQLPARPLCHFRLPGGTLTASCPDWCACAEGAAAGVGREGLWRHVVWTSPQGRPQLASRTAVATVSCWWFFVTVPLHYVSRRSSLLHPHGATATVPCVQGDLAITGVRLVTTGQEEASDVFCLGEATKSRFNSELGSSQSQNFPLP